LEGGRELVNCHGVKNQFFRLVQHEMLARPHQGPRGLRPSTTPGQSINPLHPTVATAFCWLHCAALYRGGFILQTQLSLPLDSVY